MRKNVGVDFMDITVTDAVLIGNADTSNVWIVGKEVVFDDGSVVRQAQAFSEDFLENLAAEYDLDTSDIDKLLEIVLYEPLIDDVDMSHPQSLYGAESVETAREFLLERVKRKRNGGKIKTRNRRSDEDPVAYPVRNQVLILDSLDDPALPLDVLKREIPLDDELVAVKKEFFQEKRSSVRSSFRESRSPSREQLRRRPTAEEWKSRQTASRKSRSD